MSSKSIHFWWLIAQRWPSTDFFEYEYEYTHGREWSLAKTTRFAKWAPITVWCVVLITRSKMYCTFRMLLSQTSDAHERSFLNECELYPYLCQKHTIQKNHLDCTWIIIINNSNAGIRFSIRYSWISSHTEQKSISKHR